MCIICVSGKGIAQPSNDRIKTMFENNPHGAGYMYARNGKVTIHKGFMDCDELMDQLAYENFTPDDVVIYHFRISTQAGVNPEMTHPFPLSDQKEHLMALDLQCACGIAHNGIIPVTSTKAKTDMSDTALFIQNYVPHILRTPDDLRSASVLNVVKGLIGTSKLAILDSSGYVATVGHFIKADQGLLYSNSTYMVSKDWDDFYDMYDWKKYYSHGYKNTSGKKFQFQM